MPDTNRHQSDVAGNRNHVLPSESWSRISEDDLALQRWASEGGTPSAPEQVEASSTEGEDSGPAIEAWRRVCDESNDTNAAILKVVHRLESSFLLARDAPASHQWLSSIRLQVEDLIAKFEAHALSAELPDGLIGQIEASHGRSQQVTAVGQLHRKIPESARMLLTSLEVVSERPRYASMREIAYLTAAVREHEARELDLICETDSRVMGGEG